MTSLADAYEKRSGEVSRRRVYVGTGLFAVGALMVVAGILAGTTDLVLPGEWTMQDVYAARRLAGTLVGVGIPAVFLGIFAVLPANRSQRVAAATGGALTLAGVAVFRSVYPYEWFAGLGVPSTSVLALVAVYSVGIMTVMWCLFTAIATFKRRNDPGGTVSLTYTEDGETKTVEVSREDLDDARSALSGSGSFGGVGVFGGVENPAEKHPSRTATDSTGGSTGTTADGGSTTQDITSPLDDGSEYVDAPTDSRPEPDRYCGNCAHFDYVRTDAGIQPYCGLHDDLMDDMDACHEWTRNDAGPDRL